MGSTAGALVTRDSRLARFRLKTGNEGVAREAFATFTSPFRTRCGERLIPRSFVEDLVGL
jgi:hypothetical protein